MNFVKIFVIFSASSSTYFLFFVSVACRNKSPSHGCIFEESFFSEQLFWRSFRGNAHFLWSRRAWKSHQVAVETYDLNLHNFSWKQVQQKVTESRVRSNSLFFWKAKLDFGNSPTVCQTCFAWTCGTKSLSHVDFSPPCSRKSLSCGEVKYVAAVLGLG